jgi:hypothetical protein
MRRVPATVLALLFMTALPVCGQERHRLDIPTIARLANGAVVSVVMSDKNNQPVAQGSGFLITPDGDIATNYHVIQEGTSAVIKFPDGAFYLVDGVVAVDKDHDIAIIKAHGTNFHTVAFGDSDKLQVGEDVVAIGNPLSLESTVSNGIISGMRELEGSDIKFLQITAPISPGSSGGPLFNMMGEVVGITTSHLREGENLNFAIPINRLKALLSVQSSKVQPFPSEPAATPKPSEFPTRWKSMKSGAVFVLRFEDNYIYAERVGSDKSGGPVLEQFTKVGNSYIGEANYHIVGPNGQVCPMKGNMLLTLVTPTRIEGYQFDLPPQPNSLARPRACRVGLNFHSCRSGSSLSHRHA